MRKINPAAPAPCDIAERHYHRYSTSFTMRWRRHVYLRSSPCLPATLPVCKVFTRGRATASEAIWDLCGRWVEECHSPGTLHMNATYKHRGLEQAVSLFFLKVFSGICLINMRRRV